MSNRTHGGLAKDVGPGLAQILRSRQAPGIRVSGGASSSGIRRMVIPGICTPKGGWSGTKDIDRACEAARAPGAADGEVVRNFNKGIRAPVVDVERRTR